MPSTQELDLILEIQKRECLYNFNDSSYLNKEIVAKCWEEVGSTTGLNAHEARERWRNIRSALVRSLKVQAECPSKLKKPYYLIDHLQFVLPYVKPASVSQRRLVVESDPLYETSQAIESLAVPSGRIKEEYINEDGGSEDEDHPLQTRSPSLEISSVGSPQNHEPEEPLQPSVTVKPQISVSRKRPIPQDPEKSVDDRSSTKITKPHASSYDLPNATGIPAMSPMQHFLMSLLPEFDTMTEQQLRDFKIRTLMLIDEMKNSQTGRRYCGTYDPAPAVRR